MKQLCFATKRILIPIPNLTLRWPKLVLWAEHLGEERQAGVSLVWRSRTFQPKVNVPLPWATWRMVRHQRHARKSKGISLRGRLWLIWAAFTIKRDAVRDRITQVTTNGRSLAAGVYQSVRHGELAPRVRAEYAQWQSWRIVTVLGHVVSFADVMLSLPIIIGVAASFYYAWLAWLVQTNAIQVIERNKIIMSSANAGKIIPVIVIWFFLRWYNRQPNSPRERILMNVAVLVLLGFFEAVSIGKAPA